MTKPLTPPEYVLARRVLLDALDALSAHVDAMILVGAQAVYMHTGDGDLATAPTTTDADLALAPERLASKPLIEEALAAACFAPGANPGTWHGSGGVAIDLMVPEALSGPGGRRGARLPVHGNRVARRTTGLEAAIVDNDRMQIRSFESADDRIHELRVAGPAALLIAKLVKINERLDQPSRIKPKDALDVLRLLQTADDTALGRRLVELSDDPLAADVTRASVEILRRRGGRTDAELPRLAAQAVGVLADADTIRASMAVLTEELVIAYDRAAAG
ncbi:hypothetical protein AB0I55_26795 [Actinocatenispora sera]|uniref:hypothetical protein n=1 Tax=Actinocatenispora sera TaxID=390989 RepID=UPI0033EBD83D